jgi:succinoglycan biosynthesis protein ExoM
MHHIAVCICTCDRASLLVRSLNMLKQLEFADLDPKSIILLIVDNRPNGRARAVCEELAFGLPMRLVFVEEPTPGISFARNRAVAEALERGAEMIVFIDDDDDPKPDWLMRLLLRQHETGADIVFGPWELPQDIHIPGWLRGTRYFQEPDTNKQNRYGLPSWAGTYNVLLSRRLLETMNAEGEVFRRQLALTGGSDTDLFVRARRAGFQHAVAADARVVRNWSPQRLTFTGVTRHGFKLGGTRFMVAALNEPTECYSHLKWKVLRKLIKGIARFSVDFTRRPNDAGRAVVKLSETTGEVLAALGLKYNYYDR